MPMQSLWFISKSFAPQNAKDIITTLFNLTSAAYDTNYIVLHVMYNLHKHASYTVHLSLQISAANVSEKFSSKLFKRQTIT